MPTWPAEQIPEMYPPDTAKNLKDEVQAAIDGINKVIRDNPDAKPDEQHRLIQQWCKANRYSVSWAKPTEPMQVFIASTIAPELDCYLDVSWPVPRTLDSDWGG